MMTVIRSSESDNWKDAVVEWDIDDCEEDLSCSSECVCGKENIKYLYTIRNRYSGRILYPIGSSCINKFGREDLRDATSLIESQFKLLHAVEEGRYLSLSSELFSRNYCVGYMKKAHLIQNIMIMMEKMIMNLC